jgi:hypothetical protein
VLLNPNNPFFGNQLKDLNDASRALGVKIQVERASKEDEIANAFKAFAQQHAGAVIVGADPYFFSRRSLLIDPAVQLRIPAIYEMAGVYGRRRLDELRDQFEGLVQAIRWICCPRPQRRKPLRFACRAVDQV